MSVSQPLSIQTDAATALATVARTLSELLARLPVQVRRPTDLQRALAVDYKLCWQILNITRAEDPLTVSQYVPGNTSVRRLLAAARLQGVPMEVLTDVDQAIKDFQGVVAAHSSDRQAFDSMLASISGSEGVETLNLQDRRNSFRSDSKIWGTQVATYLRQMIVKPSEDGRGVDQCFVNAKYGLRRLRSEVVAIVHGYWIPAAPSADGQVEPLNERAADYCGGPVLEKFCSQPLPQFRTINHSDGWIYSALESGQIGRKSSVNLVFGGTTRHTILEKTNGRDIVQCRVRFIAPTEFSAIELLVHRPSYGKVNPEFQVYATAAGTDVPEPMRQMQQFQTFEKVQAMGSVATVPPVPEVPLYRQQTEYVLRELGWNPADFDLYRVRISYPIFHSVARLGFAVAE